MSFHRILRNSQIIIFKNKNSSLSQSQSQCSLTATMNVHNNMNSFCGRTALFASDGRKASLTLETAIVLPIFTFLCMSMVFLCQIFFIHNEIQGSLFQAARYVSGNVMLAQVAVDKAIMDEEAAQKIVCVAAAGQRVMECSGDLLDECICLQGGSGGLQFLYSDVSEEYVDIIVNYRVRLPFAFGINASFPVVQRCRMRAWTGASGKVAEEVDPIVYITDNGMVYHTDLECTHLKLSIRYISASALESVRNNGGARYTSCEKCIKDELNQELVYITDEGDRYHSSMNCSGLKRYIQMISMSQVDGKRLCTRCVNRDN